MNDQILFLEPVFKEKIWGGNNLRKMFNYKIPSESTGECWAISGHKDGSTIIKNGPFKGQTLKNVFENNKDLFNNIENDEFPLLLKIIDANENLSIQVHPNDELASRFNEKGKSEFWIILDTKENSNIIYGHNATTKAEFKKYITDNNWDKLLKYKNIKKDDCIYIPAGKIHSINSGTTLLEIQQSSDITFRLYDYDRLGLDGSLRKLHIKEAVEATTIPDESHKLNIKEFKIGMNSFTTYIDNEYFKIERWIIKEKFEFQPEQFLLFSVIEGNGYINDCIIKTGDHFITTSKVKNLNITGNLNLIISSNN